MSENRKGNDVLKNRVELPCLTVKLADQTSRQRAKKFNKKISEQLVQTKPYKSGLQKIVISMNLKEPAIYINIHQIKVVKALFDTGAARSLISRQLFNEISQKVKLPKIYPKEPSILRTANGQRLTTDFDTIIVVYLGKGVMEQLILRLIVSGGLSIPLILGMDFALKFKAKIDFNKSHLALYNSYDTIKQVYDNWIDMEPSNDQVATVRWQPKEQPYKEGTPNQLCVYGAPLCLEKMANHTEQAKSSKKGKILHISSNPGFDKKPHTKTLETGPKSVFLVSPRESEKQDYPMGNSLYDFQEEQEQSRPAEVDSIQSRLDTDQLIESSTQVEDLSYNLHPEGTLKPEIEADILYTYSAWLGTMATPAGRQDSRSGVRTHEGHLIPYLGKQAFQFDFSFLDNIAQEVAHIDRYWQQFLDVTPREEQIDQPYMTTIEEYDRFIVDQTHFDKSTYAAVQNALLRSILLENRSCLALDDNDIGTLKTDGPVSLPWKSDERPTQSKQKSFHFKGRDREMLLHFVQKLLDQGVLEHSQMIFFSEPCFLVRKKFFTESIKGNMEEELKQSRLVVSFKKLNQYLQVPAGGTLQYFKQIKSLIGDNVAYMASIDLKAAYFSIVMSEESRRFLGVSVASSVNWNVRHARLPMGASPSPAIFLDHLNRLLPPILHNHIIIYLDDILLHANSFLQFAILLRIMLKTFRNIGLKVSIEKSVIFKLPTESIVFLGHELTPKGITPISKRLDALRKVEPPKTRKNLRSLLGLYGFYRYFLPNFASAAQALYPLTTGDGKEIVKYTHQHILALDQLRHKLQHVAQLYHIQPNKEYYINTDASHLSLAATVSQFVTLENGKEVLRPLLFYSRSVKGHEGALASYSLELLTIVSLLKSFSFIFPPDIPINIFTDSKVISYLILKDPNLTGVASNRIHRWLTYLLSLDIKIKFIPRTSVEISICDYFTHLYKGQLQIGTPGKPTLTAIEQLEEEFACCECFPHNKPPILVPTDRKSEDQIIEDRLNSKELIFNPNIVEPTCAIPIPKEVEKQLNSDTKSKTKKSRKKSKIEPKITEKLPEKVEQNISLILEEPNLKSKKEDVCQTMDLLQEKRSKQSLKEIYINYISKHSKIKKPKKMERDRCRAMKTLKSCKKVTMEQAYSTYNPKPDLVSYSTRFKKKKIKNHRKQFASFDIDFLAYMQGLVPDPNPDDEWIDIAQEFSFLRISEHSKLQQKLPLLDNTKDHENSLIKTLDIQDQNSFKDPPTFNGNFSGKIPYHFLNNDQKTMEILDEMKLEHTIKEQSKQECIASSQMNSGVQPITPRTKLDLTHATTLQQSQLQATDSVQGDQVLNDMVSHKKPTKKVSFNDSKNTIHEFQTQHDVPKTPPSLRVITTKWIADNDFLHKYGLTTQSKIQAFMERSPGFQVDQMSTQTDSELPEKSDIQDLLHERLNVNTKSHEIPPYIKYFDQKDKEEGLIVDMYSNPPVVHPLLKPLKVNELLKLLKIHDITSPISAKKELILQVYLDEHYQRILKYLLYDRLPENWQLAKATVIESDSYRILEVFFENKIFYVLQRKIVEQAADRRSTAVRYLLCLPDANYRFLAKICHQADMAIHASAETMQLLLNRNYFNRNHNKIVKQVINNCSICAEFNAKMKISPPLKSFHTPNMIFSDIKGPLETIQGYKHVAIFVDMNTRYTWLYPLVSTKASAVATAILNTICSSPVVSPFYLTTDSGAGYKNELIKHLTTALNIKFIQIWPGSSRSNLAERHIKRYTRLLLKQLIAHKYNFNWVANLRLCEHFLNSQIQRNLGFSPYELLYGVENPVMTNKIYTELPLRPDIANEELKTEFVRHAQLLRHVRRLARTNLHENIRRQHIDFYKRNYKETSNWTELLTTGTYVYLHAPWVYSKQFQNKLRLYERKLIGPFRVVRLVNNGRCAILMEPRSCKILKAIVSCRRLATCSLKPDNSFAYELLTGDSMQSLDRESLRTFKPLPYEVLHEFLSLSELKELHDSDQTDVNITEAQEEISNVFPEPDPHVDITNMDEILHPMKRIAPYLTEKELPPKLLDHLPFLPEQDKLPRVLPPQKPKGRQKIETTLKSKNKISKKISLADSNPVVELPPTDMAAFIPSRIASRGEIGRKIQFSDVLGAVNRKGEVMLKVRLKTGGTQLIPKNLVNSSCLKYLETLPDNRKFPKPTKNKK
jgi:hypothetical protein